MPATPVHPDHAAWLAAQAARPAPAALSLSDAEAFAAWPGFNPVAELLAARRCQQAAEAVGWRYVADCSPIDASGAGIVDGPSYDGTAGPDYCETVYTSWTACAVGEGLDVG